MGCQCLQSVAKIPASMFIFLQHGYQFLKIPPLITFQISGVHKPMTMSVAWTYILTYTVFSLKI